MFIRKIRTRTVKGTDYFTYRLVESVRRGNKVSQRVVLSLGSRFDLPRAQWPDLIAAIEAQRSGQPQLFETDEATARWAADICARLVPDDAGATERHHCVDVGSMRHRECRSVGTETAAMHALDELGVADMLARLGVGARRTKLALAQIASRMAHPASELETHRWLCDDSALTEMLELSIADLKLGALYRVADTLYKYRKQLESGLYRRQCDLLGHRSTVMLYDLTNTWFTGRAHRSPGQFGHSKQKRHDCPLVTLGLCVDEAGFVRRSEVLPGNVSEPQTLAGALGTLGGSGPLTVVMDAGIASDDNIEFLRQAGHDWVVVARSRELPPDTEPDAVTKSSEHARIRIWRLPDTDGDEVRLCVHSSAREQTERSMLERARQRLESELKYLDEGLRLPNRMKRHDRVLQKVGRLRERYSRVSAQYDISVTPDTDSDRAVSVSWKVNARHDRRNSSAGAYVLRTSLSGWDDERIVRLYWTLSEVEATFRSLKSELGLRPIYHQRKSRVAAHLFISVLAYQAVHFLRMRMRAGGECASWNTVRHRLSTMHRLTTVLTDDRGGEIRVRQNTEPSDSQRRLLAAMGVEYERDQRIGTWPRAA